MHECGLVCQDGKDFFFRNFFSLFFPSLSFFSDKDVKRKDDRIIYVSLLSRNLSLTYFTNDQVVVVVVVVLKAWVDNLMKLELNQFV